ncbi:trans-1,2-dihydrobenzene-1,2-diol dehydrogenase-like [Rhopilema esculentum]|uniref:trans-1,2-dihydrobenzene-1,2-diol dehydrogenase-like n=1 Tax=Rhopilema esculentum TaxID=499914 RepID=UPI0031D2460A|eukprot:gene13595-4491_t
MQVNWGILGAGNIAHDFSVALRTLPVTEHQIQAIGSRSLERAAAFAKTHKIKQFYGSYDEVFNDAEVDVVYVATVNNTHNSLILQALENGKHVLCEKPIGVNAEEISAIFQLAQEKRLFVMEGLWSMFVPSWLETLLQIKNGAIGRPRFMNFMHARKMYQKREKFYSKELAGGMLSSLGEYPLAFAYWVFNKEEPVNIVASGYNFGTGVDKTHSVTMSYRNGETLTSFISCDFDGLENAEIIGDKGKIKLNYPFWCPTTVTTSNSVLSFEMPHGDMQTNFTNSAALSYEARHVRHCLMSGWLESNVVTHKASITIARWTDEIKHQLNVMNELDDVNR